MRLIFQLAALVLVLGGAEAQTITSTAITPTPPYVADPRAQTLVGASAEMHEIFRLRSENVRLHHRPIPLEPVPPQELFNLLQSAPPPPPPTDVRAADDGALAAPGTQIVTNRGLIDAETNNFTGIIDEPSVAVRGNEVLFTGNWFAAFSWNAGGNFTYMDPAATFPAPPNEMFCCDQLTYYDRGRDLMVWVLQYSHSSGSGMNRLRVAVARGGDIPTRSWRYYDFTPQSVGGWTTEWFDFPAIATSQNFLYLTTNSYGFGASGSFKRAVILRLPLDQLANYQGLTPQVFTSEFGGLRPVHGAGPTMYIATHRSAAQVRIYEWPETSTSINIRDVSVTPWTSSMVSVPGTEWLGRADFRITAAWLAGGRIGVAWTAGRDSSFPHAHVRIARINVSNWTLSDQPHVWSSTVPYAYAAAAPNAVGQVGLGIVYGTTAGRFPSHAVGVRNDAANSWDLVVTAESTAAPFQPVWGDYFTMGLHGQNPNEWVTTGFTLLGGSNHGDIVPRYVRFRHGTPTVTEAGSYQQPK